MATDLQQVRNILVDTARNAVGDLLSTIPGPSNTTKPAVVKSRKRFTESRPPFIILDLQSRRRQGLSQLHATLQSNDLTLYETHYDYFFSYTVIGGDAMQIAGVLESHFREDAARAYLEENNIFFVDAENIIPSSDLFNGEFVEVATFNVIVTVPDTNEVDEGYFISMTLDGELYEHKDDQDPITLTITTV